MKAVELRELSITDLKENIAKAKFELNRLRLNHAISPVESPSKINKDRKEIALMCTILREKEINS